MMWVYKVHARSLPEVAAHLRHILRTPSSPHYLPALAWVQVMHELGATGRSVVFGCAIQWVKD